MSDFMQNIFYIAGVLAFLLFLAWVFKLIERWLPQSTVILHYQRGILFRKGRFDRVLESGRYWLPPASTWVQIVDVREVTETISGQEVLSRDNVTIRISLAASYAVTNPELAILNVADYHSSLYMTLQTALRDLVGGVEIASLLEKRQEIGTELHNSVRQRAAELGIEVKEVAIKDIMFPGNLKEIFAKVISAKNEGLAALERARGESAALRNLANAARMLDDNPRLFQLRLLQTLETGKGNTIVVKINEETTASQSGVELHPAEPAP